MQPFPITREAERRPGGVIPQVTRPLLAVWKEFRRQEFGSCLLIGKCLRLDRMAGPLTGHRSLSRFYSKINLNGLIRKKEKKAKKLKRITVGFRRRR